MNDVVVNKKQQTSSSSEAVNKFLLAGDRLMPEIHLRQLELTYSICESFTKNKERILKN